MYTGHIAIALGARGVRRDLPLWILVLASQGCDWVEVLTHSVTPRTRPDLYSHAYPFVLLAAGLLAALVWAWKRSTAAALSVLAVYLSHPVADILTGIKPLWLGGDSVGLGLIQVPAADFTTQAVLCVVGFAIYWRSIPTPRQRSLAAAAPLVFLLLLQGAGDFRMGRFRRLRRQRMLNAPAPVSEWREHRKRWNDEFRV
jgi:hypothetical protein